MNKKVFLSIVLVLTLVALTACGGGSKDSGGGDKLIIAAANPMTGDSAQFGDMKAKAIQLAIDEVNAEGGIDGKLVELIAEDDTGNPKEAPNVAQKIAGNNNILAVVGHWNSSCTLAARGIYEAAGIPVITDSVNKQITDGTTPHLFRISLTDTTQALNLAEYAYNVMGKRKAAILFTANDFGTGLKNDFTEQFEKLGGEVVASETYFEGQSKDFSPQLTKIKGQAPDVMFVAGYYVETALIAQQAIPVGLDVPMIGTEGISSDELVKLGGEAVEGIRFAAFFHKDVEFPGTKEFVESFRAKYNKEPDNYTALAYDSAKLILQGMKENGATREGITKYLNEVKDFPGVAGPISFVDNDVTRNILILEVKGGEIVVSDQQLN